MGKSLLPRVILGSLLVSLAYSSVLSRSTLKCYNCTWTRPKPENGLKGQLWNGSLVEDDVEICSNQDVCQVDMNQGVCVKEVFKQAGVIQTIKRFCAASSETGGCFEHGNDGTTTTICLCNDWQSCNLAPSTFSFGHYSSFIIVTFIAIFLINQY